MAERWLSVAEISEYLGVKRDTVYKWIERKAMPSHKVGRLWKFKISEVDAWVRTGEAGKDQGMAAERDLKTEQFRNCAVARKGNRA